MKDRGDMQQSTKRKKRKVKQGKDEDNGNELDSKVTTPKFQHCMTFLLGYPLAANTCCAPNRHSRLLFGHFQQLFFSQHKNFQVNLALKMDYRLPPHYFFHRKRCYTTIDKKIAHII